jgi:hypothetical protein
MLSKLQHPASSTVRAGSSSNRHRPLLLAQPTQTALQQQQQRSTMTRQCQGSAATAAPIAAAASSEVDQTLNPLVAGLKVSKTMALTDLASSMKEQGIDVGHTCQQSSAPSIAFAPCVSFSSTDHP